MFLAHHELQSINLTVVVTLSNLALQVNWGQYRQLQHHLTRPI